MNGRDLMGIALFVFVCWLIVWPQIRLELRARRINRHRLRNGRGSTGV